MKKLKHIKPPINPASGWMLNIALDVDLTEVQKIHKIQEQFTWKRFIAMKIYYLKFRIWKKMVKRHGATSLLKKDGEVIAARYPISIPDYRGDNGYRYFDGRT